MRHIDAKKPTELWAFLRNNEKNFYSAVSELNALGAGTTVRESVA